MMSVQQESRNGQTLKWPAVVVLGEPDPPVEPNSMDVLPATWTVREHSQIHIVGLTCLKDPCRSIYIVGRKLVRPQLLALDFSPFLWTVRKQDPSKSVGLPITEIAKLIFNSHSSQK